MTLADTYVSAKDVYSTIANKSTIIRWVREQGFPPGIRISERCTLWKRAEIEAWLASRGQVALADGRESVSSRMVQGKRRKRSEAEIRRKDSTCQAA